MPLSKPPMRAGGDKPSALKACLYLESYESKLLSRHRKEVIILREFALAVTSILDNKKIPFRVEFLEKVTGLASQLDLRN